MKYIITGFIHVMENLENLEKYVYHGMSWKCHGILFFLKSHGNVMEFFKTVMEKVCFTSYLFSLFPKQIRICDDTNGQPEPMNAYKKIALASSALEVEI